VTGTSYGIIAPLTNGVIRRLIPLTQVTLPVV
jgi:hypothetical protein